MTEKIKLYTFESNRAGGLIAILLYSKANFKLKKVDVDEWEEKKEKFHGQALPILKINDTLYCNEIPTLMYIGQKFKLLGKTVDDEYDTMSLLYAMTELQQKILPAYLPESEEEYKNQQKKIDDLINNVFPLYLKAFEKKLGTRKYFLSDENPTLIDIYITFFINLMFKHPLRIYLLDPILRENAPNLNNLVTSMAENELKEYYQNYYLITSPL